MNQSKFDSLIDSLVEAVKDYNLDDSFDHYSAIIEICDNCDHSFVYGKAWDLVSFVKFDCYDDNLFDEVEREVQDNNHNTDDVTLNDLMMSYAFQILKVATLKKYEASLATA